MHQQSETYYIFPVEIKLSAKELEILKIGFTTVAQIRNFKQE